MTADGRTEERRPRGELARWRDEPQLLAILGTDRRTAQPARSAHRGRPSYFDVAQRGRYEISSCTSFTSSLPPSPRCSDGAEEGGLTNDRYLSIFDDAPFEGPPPPRSLALQPLLLGGGDRGLLVGFAVGSNFARTASSIHPSILKCSGGGIANKAAFNPQSFLPSLTPHTRSCTPQK